MAGNPADDASSVAKGAWFATTYWSVVLAAGRTNRYGFTISWATHASVVIEAATNLANPAWLPIATNTLTGSSTYFSDPDWISHPNRFYRLRFP
jgi:hypothetical protein